MCRLLAALGDGNTHFHDAVQHEARCLHCSQSRTDRQTEDLVLDSNFHFCFPPGPTHEPGSVIDLFLCSVKHSTSLRASRRDVGFVPSSSTPWSSTWLTVVQSDFQVGHTRCCQAARPRCTWMLTIVSQLQTSTCLPPQARSLRRIFRLGPCGSQLAILWAQRGPKVLRL